MKPLKWFKSKIGKRIYRDDNNCNERRCKDCLDVTENGILVSDEQHAEYLYEIQNEFAAEGIFLRYRSKK